MVRFRMIHVDHYMSKPQDPFDDTYSEFLCKPTRRLPIIRIFGVNENGLKICLHVHGFYPYICVRNDQPPGSNEDIIKRKILDDVNTGLKDEFAGRLARNRANVPMARETVSRDDTTGVPDIKVESGIGAFVDPNVDESAGRMIIFPSTYDPDAIHDIESINTIPYYGYHENEVPFFKIVLYNPLMVKKLYPLFERGQVLGHFMPVYWAHIPYILLFFIDNNLRGMQFIEVDQIFYRKDRSPPQPMSDDGSAIVVSSVNDTRDQDLISELEPVSTCQLEADIRVEWIVNKQQFGSRGNDTALRELWLDNQCDNSQTSELTRATLPVFDLEKNYLQQLSAAVGLEEPSQEILGTSQNVTHAADTSAAVEGSSSDSSIEQADELEDQDDFFDSDDEVLLEALRQEEIKLQAIKNVTQPQENQEKDKPTTSQNESEFVENKNHDQQQHSKSVDESNLKEEQEFEFDDDEDFEEYIKSRKFSLPNSSFSSPSIMTSTQRPGTSIATAVMPDITGIFSSCSNGLTATTESQPITDQTEQSFQTAHDRTEQAECESSSSNDTLTPEDNDDQQQSVTSRNNNNEKRVQIKKCRRTDNSMIDGPSIIDSSSNERSQASSDQQTGASAAVNGAISHEYQHLCLMSLELHIGTRADLRPDPRNDPIQAAFYCVDRDVPDDGQYGPKRIVGIIIVESPVIDTSWLPHESTNFSSPGQNEVIADNVPSTSAITGNSQHMSSSASSNQSESSLQAQIRAQLLSQQKQRNLIARAGVPLDDVHIHSVSSELELLMSLVEIVKNHDPEILLAFEMELLSWGYVLERSEYLNVSIALALSRFIDERLAPRNTVQVEHNFVQPIMFVGRMVFSVWRIVRHEHSLPTCSYENLHYHTLKERVPNYSYQTLTRWYDHHVERWRVLQYYLIRVVGQIRILQKFDLVSKVSELARVCGTQFIDVITRGSQIGIESMMLRLARLQNLTPISPTLSQRNRMCAPESLPLVMEPESNIYYDPVAVLDFASLYPSVVIAYNYCYSTCLGRVTDIESNQEHQFGCTRYRLGHARVRELLSQQAVHVSPCGVAFLRKQVRHGVLPQMLLELITTRAKVKDQMKENARSERPNVRLQRLLEHRQHGLKMMANTTYGYTGASYTGRMPCVEIADSIVSKGRECLERAIDIVESPRYGWNAKVIYGDTDSIFVQFKDCSRDEAFQRAHAMVDAITQANPFPIKIKFEKIYQPCVLQTKKRYCGFKYEHCQQREPQFEAKGMETIRRDCCPAAQKILETALQIQFTTRGRDLNAVKQYVQRQFFKIMSGKLSNVQDYVFARQYKPRSMDKQELVFVPAWQLTKRALTHDPRAEPRFKERIPYVIVYGELATNLVQLARSPLELIHDASLRINADYYIQKIIVPTLNRVFGIIKVDTMSWYREMPRKNMIQRSHYLVAQHHYQRQQLFTTSGNTLNQTSLTKAPARQSTMSQFYSPSHCPVCSTSVPHNDDLCDTCKLSIQSSCVRIVHEISAQQRKLAAYHRVCQVCSNLTASATHLAHNGGSNYSNDPSTSDQQQIVDNPCISYDCPNLFRFHQAKLDVYNANYLAQVLKDLI